MKNRIAAIADNLHNLQWRVEEARGAIEKESGYGYNEMLEPLRKAVNNLAAVLIVAEDNLQEIEDAYCSIAEAQGRMAKDERIN